MRSITKVLVLPGVILLTCIGLWGCSKTTGSPVVPTGVPELSGTSSSIGSERVLWGIWTIRFDMSQFKAIIEPKRSAEPHFNITDMVTPPACYDCIAITTNSFDQVTRILDVDVTLRNPYQITGRDVRGILFTNEIGHLLTNPDDWTDLYEIPGGSDINPFRAFAKSEGNRIFAGMAMHIENYLVYIPEPPQWEGVIYAVDACWPGNCREPYEIVNFWQESIEPDQGASGNIYVDVRDWQDDVSEVLLGAPEITGQPEVNFIYQDGETWFCPLINITGVGVGDYDARIIARSTNSGELALYDIVTITISGDDSVGWARTWGNDNSDFCHKVAFDSDNNIYATGSFLGTVDFDPGPGVTQVESMGVDDVYCSKFDSNGNFLWVRTWGGSSTDEGYGITVDIDDDVIVAGPFSESVDFDAGPGIEQHTSTGGLDAYVCKYSSDGDFQWVTTWGSLERDEAVLPAADAGADIYIVGHFIVSGVNFDSSLTKLDSAGSILWHITWGGDGDDRGFGVALDEMSNAYTSGYFEGNVDFDPGPGEELRLSNGSFDSFAAKYSTDGDLVWVRTWGGDDHWDGGVFYFWENANRNATDSSGVYTTGQFINTVDFNPGSGEDWHTASGSDVYLVKFGLDGDFQWALTWGGSGSGDAIGFGDTGIDAITDNSGNVFVTGSFSGAADLDPGPGVDECQSEGPTDAYLSKFTSDGQYLWARTWGGPDIYYPTGSITDIGTSLAVDSSDNICVGGYFSKTSDFDPGPGIDEHISNGSYDVFLVKYKPNGYW